MKLIDTHAHLYLEQFDNDRNAMIDRAISKGIVVMLLPNIDKDSCDNLLQVCLQFPKNCFPMIGLHPTSVNEAVEEQLASLEIILKNGKFVAIGEIGIDLYWDKTFKEEQIKAFRKQLNWAKTFHLPVAIHTREAFPMILDLVEDEMDGSLTGVFHCFNGSLSDAKRIMKMGFLMGIGGVLTYKNSTLPAIVREIPMEYLVLETDAPFLPPVPYRGQRNECAFMLETAMRLAEIKQLTLDEVAAVTTSNAMNMFKLASY